MKEEEERGMRNEGRGNTFMSVHLMDCSTYLRT